MDAQQAYLQAIAHARAGRHGEALALLDTCLAADAAHWDAHAARAFLLQLLGRLEDSLHDYSALLALQPGNPHAHNDRATVLHRLGRAEEALAGYARAIELEPAHAGALNNRAALLRELGRYEEALQAIDRALAVQPGHAEALSNRATTLHSLGRLDEALASVDQALAIKPDHAQAWSNRASMLLDLGRLDEGLADAEAALRLAPGNADALNNRAALLHGLGRLEDALAGFDDAVAVAPRHAHAHAGRAAVLRDLDRPQEGLAAAESALALDPRHAVALNNRGALLFELGRVDEALRSLDAAIALKPRLADAHYNKALLHISRGEYREGFALYERRHELAMNRQRWSYPQPRWTGAQDVAGKRVLVHAEQGMGDVIQFCRYLPLLRARGAEVVAEVPGPLVPLLSTVDECVPVVATGEAHPPCDYCVALLSLPFAMGTTLDTVPAKVPYLFALPAKAAEWRSRLGPATRPRVGLAWSGSTVHRKNGTRSLPLALLAPLLALDIEAHALQTEVLERDRDALQALPLHRHERELRDFADTAALADAMDLVISVDTSAAHLAGALGKPVWILLPHVAEFRWMAGTDATPWYPTARLWRQPSPGDWPALVERVAAALKREPARPPR